MIIKNLFTSPLLLCLLVNLSLTSHIILVFTTYSSCFSPTHSFVLPNYSILQQTKVPKSTTYSRCSNKNINEENPDSTVNNSSSPITNNKRSNSVEQLLEAASRLRREAEELEKSKLLSNNNSDAINNNNISIKKTTINPIKNIIKYKSLNDSKWTIQYRFTPEPPINKREDEDNTNIAKPVYYTGKVSVMLRADGYTDIIIQSVNSDRKNDDNNKSQKESVKFVKFWGWDEDISKEDGKKYIAFSADVQFPKSSDADNSAGPGITTRIYFNARVNEQYSNIGSISSSSNTITDNVTAKEISEIQLTDGTITVKRDVTQNTNRFWGVFNAGGILAEFRYCGEFLCKPFQDQE